MSRTIFVGLPNMVAACAAVAAVALAGGSAQASKRLTVLPASTPPAFVTRYLSRNLPGARLPRGRYARDDAAAFPKHVRRAPIQVTADFNGDGKGDWAGLIRTRGGKIRLVAIYSTRQGYRHRVLQKDFGQAGYPLRVSVHLQKPGRVRETPTVNKPKTVRLRRPGISFIYFEKSSVVFYWTRGRFAQLWTSD